MIIQALLILTVLNTALCCKSRASNTEIGNMKDYISLSCIIIIIIMLVVLILVLYAVESRANDTEIGYKKDHISLCFPFNLSDLSIIIIIIQFVLILTGLSSALCCEKQRELYRNGQ